MMFWFKHIATFFLLAALGIPILMPAVLHLKQSYVQWQMHEALEKQELLQIKIKTSDIKWIKNKKECVINGEMFDVKKLEVRNDETILTGLFDQKEKQIKKNLEDFAKNQQQSNKMQQWVKLFTVLFSTTDMVKTLPPLYAEVNLHYTFINSIYSSPFLGYTTPPPKIS